MSVPISLYEKKYKIQDYFIYSSIILRMKCKAIKKLYFFSYGFFVALIVLDFSLKHGQIKLYIAFPKITVHQITKLLICQQNIFRNHPRENLKLNPIPKPIGWFVGMSL